MPKYNPRSVFVIKAADDTKQISINGDEKKAFLTAAPNTNVSLLTLAQSRAGESNLTTLTFYSIDANNGSIQNLFSTDMQININQRLSTTLSQDGRLIGLCGPRNGHCWIAVCDIEEKKVAWQKELPEPALFFNCVFSTDSKTIYARGSDMAVYKFDTADGRLEGSLIPAKENSSMLKDQNVQVTQISSDGKVIGSVVSAQVYVWSSQKGKQIFSKVPGHKLIGGIAFSPDSRFLATADMRQGGKIKIWKLPEN